jgi:hypothetical protein
MSTNKDDDTFGGTHLAAEGNNGNDEEEENEDSEMARSTIHRIGVRRLPVVQMTYPFREISTVAQQQTAARALAVMYDMPITAATLDLLDSGISSVLNGVNDTFVHCEFRAVTLVLHDGGDSDGNDGGDCDYSNEDNEGVQPPPMPSLRVVPTPPLRSRK